MRPERSAVLLYISGACCDAENLMITTVNSVTLEKVIASVNDCHRVLPSVKMLTYKLRRKQRKTHPHTQNEPVLEIK